MGCAVYALTLIGVYCFSTLSHSFSSPSPKRLFRVLDQGFIYLLIVGTYTPFALTHLRSGVVAVSGVRLGLCPGGLHFQSRFRPPCRGVSVWLYVVSSAGCWWSRRSPCSTWFPHPACGGCWPAASSTRRGPCSCSTTSDARTTTQFGTRFHRRQFVPVLPDPVPTWPGRPDRRRPPREPLDAYRPERDRGQVAGAEGSQPAPPPTACPHDRFQWLAVRHRAYSRREIRRV